MSLPFVQRHEEYDNLSYSASLYRVNKWWRSYLPSSNWVGYACKQSKRDEIRYIWTGNYQNLCIFLFRLQPKIRKLSRPWTCLFGTEFQGWEFLDIQYNWYRKTVPYLHSTPVFRIRISLSADPYSDVEPAIYLKAAPDPGVAITVEVKSLHFFFSCFKFQSF